MLDFLFIHTVRVSRETAGTPNGLGEVPGTTAVVTGLEAVPCRVENWDEIRGAGQDYRLSGHRSVENQIIYVPPEYILEVEDEVLDITNGGSVPLGKVVGINPAAKATTTELDHFEVIIESP